MSDNLTENAVDPSIVRARAVFKASGKTLDELGVLMGAESGTARRSAWQFLNKVGDPRISSLRRFCDAMGITLEELIGTGGNGKKKPSK
jgi:transcriptional regulator with XRE-family HTH domain